MKDGRKVLWDLPLRLKEAAEAKNVSGVSLNGDLFVLYLNAINNSTFCM